VGADPSACECEKLNTVIVPIYHDEFLIARDRDTPGALELARLIAALTDVAKPLAVGVENLHSVHALVGDEDESSSRDTHRVRIPELTFAPTRLAECAEESASSVELGYGSIAGIRHEQVSAHRPRQANR